MVFKQIIIFTWSERLRPSQATKQGWGRWWELTSGGARLQELNRQAACTNGSQQSHVQDNETQPWPGLFVISETRVWTRPSFSQRNETSGTYWGFLREVPHSQKGVSLSSHSLTQSDIPCYSCSRGERPPKSSECKKDTPVSESVLHILDSDRSASPI